MPLVSAAYLTTGQCLCVLQNLVNFLFSTMLPRCMVKTGIPLRAQYLIPSIELFASIEGTEIFCFLLNAILLIDR